ncbi:MAG TPA: SHOCT domain-containing protein [Thermoleophilaceae bacterium]
MHPLITYTLPTAAFHCWHHGGWWIVFPILWLLLAAFVVALFWRRGGRNDGGDSPRRILGERFARGDISADEYRDRLAELQ